MTGKKDAISSNIIVSHLDATKAVLQQIPLGWQDAMHRAIGGDLPWGQSSEETPRFAVGSSCILGELMPFYSV